MERSELALCWTMPPSTQDKLNAGAAGVRRVMLTYGTVFPDTLLYLAGKSIDVLIRFTRDDVARDGMATVRTRLAQWRALIGERLVGVICGNEVEVNVDLTFEGDWQDELAWAEKEAVADTYAALQRVGVPLIAPPFAAHGVGLGEGDDLYPGLFMYREIIAPAAHEYPYCAAHLYTHNYDTNTYNGVIDEVRLKQAARFWCSFWHKPVIFDEVGVNTGPEHERVSAYLLVARWLCEPGNPTGRRVEGLIPFVANGTAEWEGYIMRDPESYRRIGEFMAGR